MLLLVIYGHGKCLGFGVFFSLSYIGIGRHLLLSFPISGEPSPVLGSKISDKAGFKSVTVTCLPHYMEWKLILF